jgi:hypothetical protein
MDDPVWIGLQSRSHLTCQLYDDDHYFQRLFRAIMNTKDVVDDEKMCKPFNDGFYPKEGVQKKCLEIFVRSINSSLASTMSLYLFEPVLRYYFY